MRKDQINPMPDYFDRYINLVPDTNLSNALADSLETLRGLDMNLLKAIGTQTYAPDKWSVNDILQHITDTERVFCYRVLRFARKDNTATAGYDENQFALYAQAGKRELIDILDELSIVRMGTIALFKSFDEEALLQKGICWKYEMSVLAMGFTLVGHQMHHFNVMQTKYYPLAETKA